MNKEIFSPGLFFVGFLLGFFGLVFLEGLWFGFFLFFRGFFWGFFAKGERRFVGLRFSFVVGWSFGERFAWVLFVCLLWIDVLS